MAEYYLVLKSEETITQSMTLHQKSIPLIKIQILCNATKMKSLVNFIESNNFQTS